MEAPQQNEKYINPKKAEYDARRKSKSVATQRAHFYRRAKKIVFTSAGIAAGLTLMLSLAKLWL